MFRHHNSTRRVALLVYLPRRLTSPHYDDVIMTMLASHITSITVVYSIVYSGVNQRKHQSSASLAFVREIHRGPVNFPHKWPVTRKMFPFDDVIMREHYIHRNGGELSWEYLDELFHCCTVQYRNFDFSEIAPLFIHWWFHVWFMENLNMEI